MNTEISYTKIFFVILLANILTGVIFKYWIAYENEQIMRELGFDLQSLKKLQYQNEQDEQRARAQEQKRIQEAKIREQKRVQAKSAQRVNMEVCQEWQEIYAKDSSSRNKGMRDRACERARGERM